MYLYAGLEAGATPEQVLAQADADGAPFTGFDDDREFVTAALDELRSTRDPS